MKLQQGLLAWFWIKPNEFRSFNSINNICINLYRQYFPEEGFPEKSSKNAKYEILYPLMRYGLIEFYGYNKYSLSPSYALYSSNKLLTCNIPFILHENINAHCGFDNQLGIKVFEKSLADIAFLKEKSIPFSRFVFVDYLKMLSLKKIINSWNDDTVIDSNSYFLFTSKNAWSNDVSKPATGVFKKSVEAYAQRTFKLSENKWKCIPSKEENIDSINIAVMLGQILNNWDIKLTYHAKEAKLVVNNIFFPVVIERLLFINTLVEGALDYDICKREYFIKEKDFNILNKLFDNKIKTT